MLTATRERFLLAIAREIPPDHIAEIHFFQPMKQGGVESGVAVVAAAEGVPVEFAEGDLAEVAGSDAPAPAEPSPRFAVYTARYRLVLKGPDRGKWEASVFAEADAPLVTVDAVVRGVQRRAGDADPAERLSGDEVRAALATSVAAARP